MKVYVAILDTDGGSKCYGVFYKKETAMELCKKDADKYSNELYPEDYEYEKIYEDENGFCVDTLVWTVTEMEVQWFIYKVSQ